MKLPNEYGFTSRALDRFEIQLRCEGIEVEYAECGSHKLAVTFRMTRNDIENLLKELTEEVNDA